MGRGFNIPWVGGQYTMVWGRYTMGRGVDMPWVGGQNTMDRVVDIPLLRSQNTMGRGITMPCVGGRNTMCRGFDIPWVESQNTMDMGSKYIKYIEPLIHVIFNLYPWYTFFPVCRMCGYVYTLVYFYLAPYSRQER